MKLPTLVCIFLVAYGLSIYAFQAVQHERAKVNGPLKPFDEDGERVLVPALGTISLAGGVFLLVLSSTRKK